MLFLKRLLRGQADDDGIQAVLYADYRLGVVFNTFDKGLYFSCVRLEISVKGLIVQVIGEYDNWYMVKYADYSGYVDKQYIVLYFATSTLPHSNPTTASISNSPENSEKVWINVNSLNIRTQPNTDSTVIGIIPYGVAVIFDFLR